MDPDGWLTCPAVGELSTSSAVTSNEGVLMGCENVATHWVCVLAVNGQRDPEGTCTPVVTGGESTRKHWNEALSHS